MKRLTFLFLSLIFFIQPSYSQSETDVLSDDVFASNIKTVLFYIEPLQLSDPVISLNGGAQLHFMFDDLDADTKEYFYTFIHCNYDWTPSELHSNEYLQGFETQQFYDYKFSYNTEQHFTHYELMFPNADVKFLKSGNYVLKVFPDNDPEQVVITRRFMVVDSKVQISSTVHRPTEPEFSRVNQEVDFDVKYSGMAISNPMNDVRVVLMQNFRWDNAITDLLPLYLKPGELDYNYNKENQFPGGKEFRHFDTHTLRFKTDRVKDILSADGEQDVFLLPDLPRADLPYFSYKDINGKFIPSIADMPDPVLNPDYVWVNFFMPFDYPLHDGKVYVFGKMTDWKIQDQFQLQYDATLKGYVGKEYLKQGYYEYEYAYIEKNKPVINLDLLEGNYFETENTYQIFVYYRPFGNRGDELIGYDATDSFNNNK